MISDLRKMFIPSQIWHLSVHDCTYVVISTVTCQLPMTADLYTLQAKGKKPLFVQFVLENMWAVYDAVLLNRSAYTQPQLYTHRTVHYLS